MAWRFIPHRYEHERRPTGAVRFIYLGAGVEEPARHFVELLAEVLCVPERTDHVRVRLQQAVPDPARSRLRRTDVDTALEALTPMISQVAVNLQTSGIPQGIAGPYVRGDVGTIESHLEALVKYSPNLLPLYCELALAGLPYAQMNGLNKTNHLNIKELLETYKSHPKIAN